MISKHLTPILSTSKLFCYYAIVRELVVDCPVLKIEKFFSVNIRDLELTIEKSSRPDLIFINKHGPVIYDALYTSLQMESNTVENIEAVYTTLSLLTVEVASQETVIDLLQLVMGYVNF